jgi:hypothetical protein
MTDALAERLAAYGSTKDDSDWLDVRRRVRARRARVVVPVAALIAAAVAAGAFAASGGWLFSTHDRQVTARTDLRLGSRTWHVSFRVRGEVCATASASSVTRTACRDKGSFGALKLTVPGGQIWVGATVGFARRIAITDAVGASHTAQAVHAPKGTKTPLRYWAIAITASPARSITAYGDEGRSITHPLR